MYDARIVANAVLVESWRRGHEPTQLDIQKICYFLDGHHYKDHGASLIKTEFEAWQHGPVQRVLYDSFKRWGDDPIRELATSFDPIRRVTRTLPEISSNAALNTIQKYLERYAEKPAHVLVGLTHRPDTPWSITRESAKTAANIGMIIHRSIIYDHFEGIDA